MQYGRGIARLDAYSLGLGHQARLSRVGFVDVIDRCGFPWWRGSGEMRWRNAMKTSIDCQRGEALFCVWGCFPLGGLVDKPGELVYNNCITEVARRKSEGIFSTKHESDRVVKSRT